MVALLFFFFFFKFAYAFMVLIIYWIYPRKEHVHCFRFDIYIHRVAVEQLLIIYTLY
jgi:hypothetical protein